MLSFLWGFAEATVFFLVPDVLISRIALNRGVRMGVRAALQSLVGAMAGGLVMDAWGRRDAHQARELMVRLPGIDQPMMTAVTEEMDRDGARSLLRGPLRGRPYKLYALENGALRLPLGGLVAWTVPGRIVRFLLSAVGGAVGARATRRFQPRTRNRIHALLWTVFYIWFFRRL